jgi:hypothetical protein
MSRRMSMMIMGNGRNVNMWNVFSTHTHSQLILGLQVWYTVYAFEVDTSNVLHREGKNHFWTKINYGYVWQSFKPEHHTSVSIC